MIVRLLMLLVLMSSPSYAYNEVQFECMAKNVYFEARGASDDFKTAVIFVVLNRVASTAYPNTVCKVVTQSNRRSSGKLVKHECQFSWFCDGLTDNPLNQNTWQDVQDFTLNVLDNRFILEDPSGGALLFHRNDVSPSWKNHYQPTVVIDNHTFYR